jgi:histidinol-phosphate aminotransferase
MSRKRLNLIAERLAAAIVGRARRYRQRLFAPDEHAGRLAQVSHSIAQLSLDRLVVVITGSSRGIGLTLATALARAGARLAINGRDPGRVRTAAAEIERAGGKAVPCPADVSTVEGARRLVLDAVAAFGRIDVLVNNAGVLGPHDTKPWAIEPAAWDPVIDTNLRGPFLCAREAMRWMVANGTGGRIVNVSSGAGRMAAPGMAPYIASKFGLEGLTRALALDADGTGIAVCAVELGTVRTDMARAITTWEDHTRLPPPETVVPVFLHALTGSAAQVHDRVFAAWRHEQDAEAEAALAAPLASFPKASFAPFEHRGRQVRRSDPGMKAFDRAENPLGMPTSVRRLLAERAAEFNFSRYPDENYPRLRRALADRLGLPPENFTFGPGSAELVERTLRTFAGRGDEVVSNDPTWFMFERFCAQAEIIPRKAAMIQHEPDGAFDHNLEEMAKAVGARTRLVYLVNPSNPLTSGIQRAHFMAFLDAIPPTVPVVVDEAYLDFCDNPDVLRTHEVVRDTDRIVIGLRTFSKFYGLAGLRIGYAFGTPQAIRLFDRLEHLFAVSSIAEEAAITALEDEEHARATHALLRAEKARLRAELGKAGLASVPSEIHFMLVQCPVPAAEADRVWGAFADADIIIPRGIMFDRYMMLPVLQPQQNDRHISLLASLIAP